MLAFVVVVTTGLVFVGGVTAGILGCDSLQDVFFVVLIVVVVVPLVVACVFLGNVVGAPTVLLSSSIVAF